MPILQDTQFMDILDGMVEMIGNEIIKVDSA